jgi:hypothetical protein
MVFKKYIKSLIKILSQNKPHTTAIRGWIQKYKPERLSYKNLKISEFIIDDETQIKVYSSEFIWL